MLIDGPQHQQATLDRFYAQYDVEFPQKKHYMSKFRAVLRSLDSIRDFLESSRFSKKSDFYGLFGAVSSLIGERSDSLDLSRAKNALEALHEALLEPAQLTDATAKKYYATVIEGPNKIAKRSDRIQILVEILRNRLRKLMSSLRDSEVTGFIGKVDSLISHHRELKIAIHNKRNEASLQSELAIQLALSLSVLWESFIHDILVAYILTDSARALCSLEERVRQSVQQNSV